MPARTQRNLERIERVLAELHEMAPAFSATPLNGWRERARLAIAAVYGDPSPQLERFDGVRYSVGASWSGMDRSYHDNARRGGAQTAGSQLQAIAEDLREHVNPGDIPSLDPAAMHPWVADAAAKLWQDGYRRQAVQSAATAVETWLRAKLGVHDGPTASIVAGAFSTKAPAADSPRLRFADTGPEDSDGWRSAHEGAGAFGRGCFMRIRNLYTHHEGASEQADLEALAALSLLARWIDDADVETV